VRGDDQRSPIAGDPVPRCRRRTAPPSDTGGRRPLDRGMSATAQHAGLAGGRWRTMSLLEQMANIGSEVDRALRAADQGRIDRRDFAAWRALEVLDLTA